MKKWCQPIAKQLYPDADIHITGYENSGFPDDFFDVAIGNVPFGNYQVFDRRYEKQHFMIHDYFFAKTLDQLRSGGIIAFITSKGTMDKKSDTVRAYLSQRAELLGAIRLPNNAFKNNAGTEVTSDILFFQKREGISYDTPEWLNLGVNEDGIELNQYFITHPEMILAEKVKQWYKLYQEAMLKQGKETEPLNKIDMETYQKTAEMSTEEYINTGDEKVKEANQKYENKKSSAKKVQLAEDKVDYDYYDGNKMYQKFTKNKETLVDSIDKRAFPESFKDYFVSKVPGTPKSESVYLAIPKEQVFLSEDSKTYIAFCDKSSKPFLFNQNLNVIGSENRPFARELFEKYYKLSEKEKKKAQTAQKKMEMAAGKTVPKKQVKAPIPPIKAK